MNPPYRNQPPNQPPYEPPPVVRRKSSLPGPLGQFDPWTLAIVAGIIIAGCMCLAALGVLAIFLFAKPPPPPATPIIATEAAVNVAPITQPTAQPSLDPASVGKVVNPMVSAGLEGMTVLQIDVLDQATGNYTRAAQLTDTDLDIFAESLNISVQTVTPNTDCPDHVRLSITRADNSVVTMGVCLKVVVILRGIPDLGGADAPMGPRFSDALAPYLPDAYKKLLNF
ncbi:MAG: hypothetical protein ABI947_19655 [Chloroflexota bacterium]